MALEAASKLQQVNLLYLQSWGISAELQKIIPINPSSTSHSRAGFFLFKNVFKDVLKNSFVAGKKLISFQFTN